MPISAAGSAPSARRPSNASQTSHSSNEEFHDARFPPDEEAALLSESNSAKTRANTLFSSSAYDEAIKTYDEALASCPNYLDYEIAVLQSNISACHLKLEEWKDAVEAATRSLDRLETIDPLPKPKKKFEDENVLGKDAPTPKPNRPEKVKKNSTAPPPTPKQPSSDDTIVELPSDDEDATTALANLKISDTRKSEVNRIRAKALLRRARARLEQGGWSNLAGAEEDYKLLSTMTDLPPSDQRTVRSALRDLPAKVNAAREKEMGDMMGKLKELGNGILKPFGLSTDNFNMIKDEKTGGYSMNFQK